MNASEGPLGPVEQVELELHGVVYSVSVCAHGDELLVVKIEDTDTLDTWHGEFAAKYVEDITSKTGSFKKFSVFVRMLQSAVLQQSDSVFVDLLTCQDLEMLKAKKAAAAAAATGDGASAQQQSVRQLPASLSSKRYLILTYASEFDRVHYPLPLLADEQPDPARFKAVIASLRQQLAAVQAGLAAPQLLQPQGGQQLLAGRQQRSRSRGSEQAADADAALLVSRLEVAQAELEGERAAHRREMRRKVREIQELQEELGRSRDVARELRLRIKALEAELEAARTSSNLHASAASAGPSSKGGYRRPAAAADRYTYGSSSSYLAGSSKFPSRPTKQYTGGGSQNSSRRSSPASSRGNSPAHSRPWAQNSSPSTRPPRPSSAPPKPRFDPTEYVRQKREREQQLLAARRSSSASSRGGGSPAPSVRSSGGGADRSGTSTPRSATSLASSFHSSRSQAGRVGGAAAITSISSRGAAAGSSLSRHQRPAGDPSSSSFTRDFGRPGSAGRQQQQQQQLRPGSSDRNSRDQLGAIYGVAAGRGGGGGGGGGSRSSSRQRLDKDACRDGAGAASPGRALQGVRDKLDAYYAKQHQRTNSGMVRTAQALPSPDAAKAPAAAAAMSPRQLAVVSSPKGAASSGVFKDASSEIADIDQRLHALQNFLKMAKSSVGAG